MSTRPPLIAAAAGALLCAAAGCGEDAPPSRDDIASGTGGGGPQVCEVADPPAGSFQLRGFLENAEYWACAWPGEGSEPAHLRRPTDEILGVGSSDELSGVSGSTVSTWLEYAGADSLDGRHIYFTYTGARGFYVVPAPSNESPQSFELYLDADAPSSTLILQFAVDDGASSPDEANLGPALSIPLHLIHVGSGDVQVNLHWDTLADLDLHVFEPSGQEIYFGNPTSVSGGQLDLDSYAACTTNDPARGNENIFWPDGNAPAGEYTVEVDMWSNCDTFAAGRDTNYRVTVILHRTDITVHEGTFQPPEESQIEVTRFGY